MKKIFRFPLKQHIGVPAAPTVVEGDKVVRGQLLASKGENQLSANIHSSVSGIVIWVDEHEICIQADEVQKKEYEPLQGKEPLSLIEEAGIVGLGGAGFPTYAKLKQPLPEDGIAVINAAECEPILEHNLAAILKNPEQVIGGLQIVMEILQVQRGIIAIKEVHTEAISRLRKEITDRRISVSVLPDRYPMGEERALLRETLGVLLGVESLPLEAHAVVINAETACRIWEAVEWKKPLIDKNITIAGKKRGNTNLIQVLEDVPIGISVGDVFEQAGGLADEYGELIMGGPFTGRRTSLEEPVRKTTGGVIAAECFPKGPDKIGLLVCACGADQTRLMQIAESMGSEVAGVEFCKQAHPVKGGFKCENPGRCPGQVQKVMALKKAGAEAVLISSCTDCSNTVMACAPKLGLPVYHCTDGALRAVNQKLIRKIHS